VAAAPALVAPSKTEQDREGSTSRDQPAEAAALLLLLPRGRCRGPTAATAATAATEPDTMRGSCGSSSRGATVS